MRRKWRSVILLLIYEQQHEGNGEAENDTDDEWHLCVCVCVCGEHVRRSSAAIVSLSSNCQKAKANSAVGTPPLWYVCVSSFKTLVALDAAEGNPGAR